MGEEALAVLGPGQVFGEMALLDESPRSADARVHERCLLLAIPKDGFDDLLFLHKDLAYEVLWSIVQNAPRPPARDEQQADVPVDQRQILGVASRPVRRERERSACSRPADGGNRLVAAKCAFGSRSPRPFSCDGECRSLSAMGAASQPLACTGAGRRSAASRFLASRSGSRLSIGCAATVGRARLTLMASQHRNSTVRAQYYFHRRAVLLGARRSECVSHVKRRDEL